MLRVNGMRVIRDDAHTLVDLLLRVGRAEDLSASAAIEAALTQRAVLVNLSAAGSDAVLAVLEGPPEGLVGLRGALARDHRDRHG